jgi:hypothetical protein
MDTKLYLTTAAVVAILYALAFLVIPVQASLFFSRASMRRPRSCVHHQTTGGVRPNASGGPPPIIPTYTFSKRTGNGPRRGPTLALGC